MLREHFFRRLEDFCGFSHKVPWGLYSLKLTYIAPETNMGLVQMSFPFWEGIYGYI